MAAVEIDLLYACYEMAADELMTCGLSSKA